VNCGTLEGVLVFIFRTWPGGKLFVKEMYHLNLHRGLGAHEMDARPHVWGIIDDEICTWKIEEVSFGGIFSSLEDEAPTLSTWTLAFGGLLCHSLSP
jgi:hypothetical protein